MGRLKELKYLTLVMLLFGFIATASLSSCREHEEHPTNDADEHPKTEDEHPKSE